MEFPSVGVLGGGTMGAGVAQSLAQTGHRVVVVDLVVENVTEDWTIRSSGCTS